MTENISQRLLAAEDAEAMARLHIEVWEDAYAGLMPPAVFADRRAGFAERIEMWRRVPEESPAATTVAEYDGELVGFVSVGPARDDDVDAAEELWALYVRADWWGRNVGRDLLAATLGDRPAYLWVLEGNERAAGFYRKHGFVDDGSTRADEFGVERRMVRKAST